MNRRTWLAVWICLGVSVVLLTAPLEAQRPIPGGNRPRPGGGNERRTEPEPPPLPTDPKLLTLHRDFVLNAEKLAVEYERAKQYDKAKACYTEIAGLVRSHTAARDKLAEYAQREATAQTSTFEVAANKAWQDTGIRVLPGKPVTIRSAGRWTFKLSASLGAEGMQIPDELKDYNLGCLLAVIDTGNPEDYAPFTVGAERTIVPSAGGRLMVRMYDIDPSDNEGSLQLQFQGTYEGK